MDAEHQTGLVFAGPSYLMRHGTFRCVSMIHRQRRTRQQAKEYYDDLEMELELADEDGETL